MIKEVAPTTADGYEYSTKEYFVKVVLSEDTVNNRIVATTTYYADSIDNSNIIDEDDMVFLNKEKEAVNCRAYTRSRTYSWRFYFR